MIFRASKKGLYVYSKSAGGAAIGLVLIQREHFNNNNTTLQYNPKILEAIENEDSQDDPNLDFLQFSIALKDILSTVSVSTLYLYTRSTIYIYIYSGTKKT